MTTLASCFALASVFSGRRLEPRDTGDIQVRVFKKLVGRSGRSSLITRSSI